MSEDARKDIPPQAVAEAPIPFPIGRGGGLPPGAPPADPPPPPSRRPRIKKLRLLMILSGLSLIAVISTVFGMMMAVAADVGTLDNRKDLANARNSVLYDVTGKRLGILTSQKNRILVTGDQIPLVMKHAIVAIEDKRFYTNSGVDIRGIARAFFQDILRQRAVQGASTIPQQFVKNALQAQTKRTLFQKLREAALAYHLTRRWDKDKILTEYLNSIYFGNGAYGIESAARTYFATAHPGCGSQTGPPCVAQLTVWEAALLAGVVSNPSAYNPVEHYQAAIRRRNVVLKNMLDQHYLTASEYASARTEAGPTASQVQPPAEQTIVPSAAYFTTWIKQQLVDRYGPQVAFEGGLKIHTTLDLDLQRSAEQAVNNYLADPSGPTASLVAIDNATGEVRAMVGGRNFKTSPFNLATQGQRQPGSAFKAFVLAQALREGISPDSVWPSQKRVFVVPHGGGEKFVVNNDESTYVGSRTLTSATTYSDNSVYAAVGIQAGVGRIANLAQQMGIRTPVSHNYAITLGGLKTGVTPLDMAHAYETLAHGGQRVTGTLGATSQGPVGIREVDGVPRVGTERNHSILRRVLSPSLVSTETSMLQTVVQSGTGTAASLGAFAAGKTGTTSNYGDAWFVGWNRQLTVAVWVGYPDRLKSMKTDFNGKPVMGGTFPALIWHDFMTQAISVIAGRAAAHQAKQSAAGSSTSSSATSGGSGGGSSTAGSAGGGASSARGARGGSGAGQGAAGGGSGGGRASGGGGPPHSVPTQQPSAPAASAPAGGGSGGGGHGGGSGAGGSGGGGGGAGQSGGASAGGTGGAPSAP